MNEWNLKIELEKNDIENLENYLKSQLPKRFLDFLKDANASFPLKDILEIKNETYVINNILDFRSKSNHENFYKIYEDIKDEIKSLVPFARDGLGNYFLIDLKALYVFFYDHETSKIIKLLSFEDFLNNLKEYNESDK
jgi:hypothetical protein